MRTSRIKGQKMPWHFFLNTGGLVPLGLVFKLSEINQFTFGRSSYCGITSSGLEDKIKGACRKGKGEGVKGEI